MGDMLTINNNILTGGFAMAISYKKITTVDKTDKLTDFAYVFINDAGVLRQTNIAALIDKLSVLADGESILIQDGVLSIGEVDIQRLVNGSDMELVFDGGTSDQP